MDFSTTQIEETNEVNLTPLIDVLLILLVFFMVSTTFGVSSSIKVNLPKAASGIQDSKAPQSLVIEIGKDGQLTIDGKKLDIDKLQSLLEREDRRAAAVLIRADQQAEHGRVVSVIDTLRIKGYSKFSIATTQAAAETTEK